MIGPPLNFNLTNCGLAVTGTTNSREDLQTFIDHLVRLLPLLPEAAAQGTEAGTAETEGLGPKDDGPVAKPCAQTPEAQS